MIAIARLPFDSKATLIAVAIVSLLTLLFAWNQNRRKTVGGPISTAKTLWLNYTILVFLAMPLCLWLNPDLSPEARRLFGWIFGLFFARAAVELWMLYFTRAWKCIHGITHDFVVLAVCIALAVPLDGERDLLALQFAGLIGVSLVVEAFMAWQFSKLASPADGIYFADETPHFRFVNRASWVAAGTGYPALGALLWSIR